jgi:hypothetical protein
MIKKYSEFINESLDVLLESNVVYSEKLRRALSKIESPVAKKLLEIENKDFPVQSNYFDISLDKNDVLNFIPDRKAQEILSQTKEIYRFIGSGGGWLKHKDTNKDLFDKLGYTYEEGTEPYKPNSRDIGTVAGKVTSETSGKTYFWIKWFGGTGTDKDGVELGQGVYNQEKLRLIDTVEALMREVWSKNRQDVKVGRGARALLRSAGITDLLDKDFETFVNLFKSTIDKLNDKFSYFDVVKGDDIHYWYGRDRYYESRGTLGSSCMAGAYKEWLEIYTDNPNQVNLVIFKSQDDDSKIVGRAILWTLTDGKKFMDRIYTINDSDVNLFREFAKENGWYSKYHNSSTDSGRCIAPDGSTVDLDLTVNLDNKSYRNYPYLDTLKYFREGTGILSNEKRGNSITLEDTDGGYVGNCEYCGGSGSVECSDCYGSGRQDCSTCDGDSEVDCSECDGEGTTTDDEGNEINCTDCSGTGKVECSDCDGSGRQDCENCDGRGEVSCYEC